MTSTAPSKTYRRGLTLAREIGDRGREEILLSNLGVLFTNKGDYRQALDALDAAMEIGQEQPRYWRRWITHYHLGALMMQMGRLDVARNELTNASEQLCEAWQPAL